jgi:hypothetical protein
MVFMLITSGNWAVYQFTTTPLCIFFRISSLYFSVGGYMGKD